MSLGRACRLRSMTDHNLTPCMWFDGQAEEAAAYYVGLFPDAAITNVMRQADGTALLVSFDLEGRPFTALNGGPHFTFNEAISFAVHCDTQEEVDRFWDAFTAEGEEGPCGWCKDRYGVSWQIVPRRLIELMNDPATAPAAMPAMMKMHKIVVAELEEAVRVGVA